MANTSGPWDGANIEQKKPILVDGVNSGYLRQQSLNTP